MIHNSTTPSSLLWAYQLQREHAHLLARIHILESAAAATAASASNPATAAELMSSAITQLEERVRVMEACRLRTNEENNAFASTVRTEIAGLDKLLARVTVLEAVVVKSEELEGRLTRYTERAQGFVNDMEIMRRTVGVLEAGKMRQEDEGKKLAKRIGDVDVRNKRMEDKLWAVENAVSNVEAGMEEDRELTKYVVRNFKVQNAAIKEDATVSMVVQALQGLNGADQVIKKRAESLEKRLAVLEKQARGLDISISAAKLTEQNGEPRRVIPASHCPASDINTTERQVRPSSKLLVYGKATPINDTSRSRISRVVEKPGRNSELHIGDLGVPQVHKNKTPRNSTSQLGANSMRSLSQQTTQTESEIEVMARDSQTSYKLGLEPGLKTGLISSHRVVEEKPNHSLSISLAAHNVHNQGNITRLKDNDDHVKLFAAEKSGAGVSTGEYSMQMRSRETFKSPNVARNPRPLPKSRTIALSPPQVSSPRPLSSLSQVELGYNRRPEQATEQATEQRQPPQKRRRREILQTLALS